MPESATILPAWVTLPVAAITLIFLAAYALALQEAPMPPMRRRIRTANTLVMMFGAGLIACGVSVVPASDGRLFVLVWMVVIWLMAVSVLLACFDATTTMRAAVRMRGEARAEMREKLRGDLNALRSTQADATRGSGTRG